MGMQTSLTTTHLAGGPPLVHAAPLKPAEAPEAPDLRPSSHVASCGPMWRTVTMMLMSCLRQLAAMGQAHLVGTHASRLVAISHFNLVASSLQRLASHLDAISISAKLSWRTHQLFTSSSLFRDNLLELASQTPAFSRSHLNMIAAQCSFLRTCPQAACKMGSARSLRMLALLACTTSSTSRSI